MEKTAAAPVNAKRYKATTPSKNYNGRTFGVRFEAGVAYFDELTINKDLGLTAAYIADRMVKDFEYTVEEVGVK